jgi:hypothetical protein
MRALGEISDPKQAADASHRDRHPGVPEQDSLLGRPKGGSFPIRRAGRVRTASRLAVPKAHYRRGVER